MPSAPATLRVQALDLQVPNRCACCLRPSERRIIELAELPGVPRGAGDRLEYSCCDDCQRHGAGARAARWVFGSLCIGCLLFAFGMPNFGKLGISPFAPTVFLLASLSVPVALVGWLLARAFVKRSPECTCYEQPLHVIAHDGEGWLLRAHNPRFAELLREHNPGRCELLSDEAR